jgi:hypothetical protein
MLKGEQPPYSVCSDSYTRCRRESESSLSGSSAFEEGELDEQECPVCYENLDETNIAVLKRGCGHKFWYGNHAYDNQCFCASHIAPYVSRPY